jgi:hypothetical protein
VPIEASGRRTANMIKGARLVLQRDFTPVSEIVIDVVFDARDTPHDCALGGIARPPSPSQYRIRVWTILRLTTDGLAQRSNRSRFF